MSGRASPVENPATARRTRRRSPDRRRDGDQRRTYLLLQYAWLGVTPFMAAPFDARLEADWEREAADVRGAAAAADAVAPSKWRAAAWRLGFQIGYAGHILGSFARFSTRTTGPGQATHG